MEQVTANDAILLLSLGYSSVDIMFEWGNFRGCIQPIHWWLLVSYCFVIAFRVSHLLGKSQVDRESEDFLLNLRQQKTIPRVLVKITWLLLLPVFMVWTITGSIWFKDVMTHTPECLPMGAHPWFIGFWQVLSYLWIVVHVVFCLLAVDYERRIRSAENDAREVESDADVLQRWGRMSEFSSYGTVTAPWVKKRGLSANEIKKLPCVEHYGSPMECSICLNDVVQDESVRYLPGCGHLFHKSCIDLWLLRRADCPLCKCVVTKDHLKGLQGVSV